ncbi:MAG: hypothetical protein RIE86_01130 [Imperialibacter sp.]|uniref:hypothetical protein n=1 Tax=Imperialibacter sp. TaxID=2038411 RepID=UPI0032EAEC28
MESEVVTLIIGTILGAAITFCFSVLEKRIERRRDKKNATILLKIELGRMSDQINGLGDAQSSFGLFIPSTDLPELEASIQLNSFVYYDNKLAEKIYDLAMSLRSANKHRAVAHLLIHDQKNPNFQSNAIVFSHEFDHIKNLISDLKQNIK